MNENNTKNPESATKTVKVLVPGFGHAKIDPAWLKPEAIGRFDLLPSDED